MPGAIPTPCRAATCPAVTTNRNGYCDGHQAKASGWMNQDRSSSTQRGYGGWWKRIRARIMRRDKALCQPCQAEGKVMPAVAVDHIIPKAEGGTDADENLQAICKRCHKLKTQQESLRARGRGQKSEGQKVSTAVRR